MKLCLTYFKVSGKFYTEAEHEVNLPWHEVITNIRILQRIGRLPGLVPNAGKEFLIHVQPLPDGVPRIIQPLQVLE